MASKNSVVIAADDRYLIPVCVFLFSAAKNAEHQFQVTICFDSNELSKVNREIIRNVADLTGVSLREFQISLPLVLERDRRISPTSLSRLIAAEKLKCPHIWIDVDTLLLNGWSEIFSFQEKLESGIFDFAAVEIEEAGKFLGSKVDKSRPWRGSAQKDEPFFQAGVMVWGTLKKREWLQTFKNRNALGFRGVDQDLVNYLYGGKQYKLPANFNAVTEFRVHPEAYILHFAGWWKPWEMTRWMESKCRSQGCSSLHWWNHYYELIALVKTSGDAPLARLLEQLTDNGRGRLVGRKTRAIVFVGKLLGGKGKFSSFLYSKYSIFVNKRLGNKLHPFHKENE